MIDQAPILSGNRVEIFVRGDDAFASMLSAIEGAQSEILVESYIFRSDSTGHRFLHALGRAVERGVAVKLLADAVGSFGTKAAFWSEMEARGIEARLFHPLASSPWVQIFRDHRKILVVDRRIGFAGGMNIGEEYGSPWRSRRDRPPQAWRDTHARVEGPSAWELAVVFREAWSRTDGSPIDLPRLAAADAEGSRVLVLDSRPRRGHLESAAVFAAIAGACRRRLWITNAYFAPGRLGAGVLASVADRGVDVRLLLPGLTDLPVVRHAAHGYYRELLRHGVRIFEYGDAILHAKTLVADDSASVVGSSNLDFRSFHYNAECNLVFFGAAQASALADAFEADLAKSTEIRREEWNARSFLHCLGDALARRLSPIL